MLHVYYHSSFWQINIHVHVNVMQIQVFWEEIWPSNFVRAKQSLLTVDKSTLVETGSLYTAVQIFSTVNKHVYLLKTKEDKEAYILVAL